MEGSWGWEQMDVVKAWWMCSHDVVQYPDAQRRLDREWRVWAGPWWSAVQCLDAQRRWTWEKTGIVRASVRNMNGTLAQREIRFGGPDQSLAPGER